MHHESVPHFRPDLLREFVGEDDGVVREVEPAFLEVLGELDEQRIVLAIVQADDADPLQVAVVFNDEDAFRHRHGGNDFGALSQSFS